MPAREGTVAGAKIVGMTDPRAGQRAAPGDLIDVAALVTAYYTVDPDPAEVAQQVSFGTSGHRGSAFDAAFNEAHILATTQAICEYRAAQGYDGPLFVGRDTHALSGPAWTTALEVLVANDVTVLVDAGDRYTPTPAVSHAILRANQGKTAGLADGIVVTPSHNPPRDGGFKYNPPSGGPADTDATKVIADRANQLLFAGLDGVRRVPFERAQESVEAYDFMGTYVDDLPSVLDLDAIRDAGVRIGADPLGGASVDYWGAIAERHRLDLTVVNPLVDPTWRFMTLDWDGKIRMDCSSPSAMASLVGRKDEFQIATGNDADADRHGIVTPDGGLMNPNHFLAVAIAYLLSHRPQWAKETAVGKTLVSSSLIDRVVADMDRRLIEVPVGFKWFVPGLLDGSVGFGGEESAGASFLRRDGIGLDDGQGRHAAGPARRGDPGRDGPVPLEAAPPADRPLRGVRIRADRRPGDARAEGGAGEAVARGRLRDRAGRRADHRQADQCARQRRPDRRAQGGHRERLVRRPPVGDRGRLQGLRRVLPWARAPEAGAGGGPGGRHRRAGWLTCTPSRSCANWCAGSPSPGTRAPSAR